MVMCVYISVHFKPQIFVLYSMERQLKEFQSLLQEKDEQVSQLMEEGMSQQIDDSL